MLFFQVRKIWRLFLFNILEYDTLILANADYTLRYFVLRSIAWDKSLIANNTKYCDTQWPEIS